MFIRTTTKKDPGSGNLYTNYQLVEAYRSPRGPRQRILLTIGSNISLDKGERKELANCIEELLSGTQLLFRRDEKIEMLAEEFAEKLKLKRLQTTLKEYGDYQKGEPAHYETVDLNSLKTSLPRTIGIEYLLYETARELGLEAFFIQQGMSESEALVALASIIGRATFPGSERRTHFMLKNRSGLDEILGKFFKIPPLTNFYKISDQLLKLKAPLEEHLEATEKTLFGLDDTIILYDLTNTYFEGLAKHNPKAKRGRSKEKRSDCPLVTFGLVLNRQGFPKRSEFFSGNVVEQQTLKTVIDKLSSKDTSAKPVIVMDAGLVSKENLAWLTENDYQYVTVFRQKSKDLHLAPELGEWTILKETSDNLVKGVWKENKNANEKSLFCISSARMRREEKIKKAAQEKFEQELNYLNEGLSKFKRMKDFDLIEQKIGKLRERYKRVSRFYTIEINRDESGKRAVEISWKVSEEPIAHSFDGAYCLRTTMDGVSERELWNIYMMLTEVESAFRAMKSELGLRPVYHQLEKRTDGHIWITLLAYHLTHCIRHKLKGYGINLSWESIRDVMENHMRVTTSIKDKRGRVHYVRTTTDADASQRKIYHALGINPQPLRRVRTVF